MTSASGRLAALLLAALLLAGCASTGGTGGNGGSNGGITNVGGSSASDSGSQTGASAAGSHSGTATASNTASSTATGTGSPAGNGTGDGNSTVGGGTDGSGNGTSDPGPDGATGPGDGASSEPIPVPVLKAGDSWVRRDPGGGEPVTWSVEGIEQHGGYESYVTVMRVDSESEYATTHAVSKTWTRTSDLALIESHSEMTMQSGAQHYNFTVTATYAEPCVQMQWPLVPGSSWQSTCRVHVSSSYGSSDATQVTNYTAKWREPVSVPAGTFDALMVQSESRGATTTDWYSPEACGSVKTVAGQPGQQSTTELVSYEC